MQIVYPTIMASDDDESNRVFVLLETEKSPSTEYDDYGEEYDH